MGKSKEYEMAIKIAGQVEQSFKNSMGMTERELRRIAREAARSNNAVRNSLGTGFRDAGQTINAFSNGAKKALKTVAKAATVTATAVTGLATASISVGKSFEAQMSTVQSICGATGSDMEALNEKAKQMGETTSFSATQAGQAMEYMAMAGWKTENMLDGIDGIMNLAAASGEELGSVSDIVTDAMTAFGMKADEAARFSDVLAMAASNSNTNVALMGETFKYVAPVAGSLGYSVEDAAVAIGLMANSGIKASSAGTSLRRLLTNLAKPTKTVQAAMDRLGISLTDSSGKVKPMSEQLVELRKSFDRLTDAEKASEAANLAGQTGMSGLLAIVNASEKDFNKLTKAINNSKGAAQDMANIRIDNLQGDITLFESAAEGLGIEAYEQMNTGLRTIMQSITGEVGEMTKYLRENRFIEEFTEDIPTLIRKLKELGESISDFAEPFLNVARWMVENPAIVEGTLAGITTTIISLKTAQKVYEVSKSFSSLATVLTNPFAVGILAVGAAIGGAAGIATYVKKCNEEMKKQNLAEHFGEISLSLDELQEVAHSVLDNGSLTKLGKAMDAFDEVESISREIQDTVKELDKMNWKISIGMELTNDEKIAYRDDITSFIKDTQSVIEQKQYAMSINLKLFTDNDAEGKSIRNTFNEFYQKNLDEVEGLGKKLQKTVNRAFNDGVLTIDEAEKIQELQEQIASISEKIAGSEFDAQMEVLNLKYSGGELSVEDFKNLQAELEEQLEEATGNYEEALQMNIAGAKVMLEEGEIDKTEYDKMIAEFKENYLEQVGELELKVQDFSLNTIMEQYSDELETAIPGFKETLNATTSELFNNEYYWDAISGSTNVVAMDDLAKQIANSGVLEQSTKDAISELLGSIEPTSEEIQGIADKYRELGKEIPESIQEGIMEAATLGAITGNENAAWLLIGDVINNNKSYTETVNHARETGVEIPEKIDISMSNYQIDNQNATKKARKETEIALDEEFQNPFEVFSEVITNVKNIMNVEEEQTVTQSTTKSKDASKKIAKKTHKETEIALDEEFQNQFEVLPEIMTNMQKITKEIDTETANIFEIFSSTLLGKFETPIKIAVKTISELSGSGGKVKGYATGGIITRPTLATFAEEGPEAAIPLDGSERAKSLWLQAGEILGMNKKESVATQALNTLDKSENISTANNISYSPQFTIYGNASREDLDAANKDAQQEFEKMLEKYLRNQKRFSFSG